MDNKNLTFHRTLTVEQFKAEKLVSKLPVKRNPHTGKLFMLYGSKTAAVRSEGVPECPMVSLVTPKGLEPTLNEKGEFDETKIGDPNAKANTFWLLHEEGKGGAETIAVF